MKVFFDSSGFAKRFVQEPGSKRVEEICLEATELGLSVLCIPEIISALCRRKRETFINQNQYTLAKQALLDGIHDVFLIQITSAVIQRSIEVLEKYSLRTIDALHIGSALEWQPKLFVSSDKKQVAVAKDLGLKTELV